MFKVNKLYGLTGQFNHIFNVQNLITMARYINLMTKEINRLEEEVAYLSKTIEEMKKNDKQTA